LPYLKKLNFEGFIWKIGKEENALAVGKAKEVCEEEIVEVDLEKEVLIGPVVL